MPDGLKRRFPAEYGIWESMKIRCSNPNRKHYHRYGGRGIRVCERWSESFAAFLEDVGPRPSPAHSIDRYPDNDGHYEPGNVRWATAAEQSRNTRRNRLLTFQGETMPIVDWAAKLGMDHRTIRARIDNYGWSVERALSEPIVDGKERARRGGIAGANCKFIEFRGERRNLKEWAAVLGMKYDKLAKRLNTLGWSVERALTTP